MPRLPDLATATRLLVLKPSSLGDIVHTLPAVRNLKRTFPHLAIDWLVNPEWMPLLAGNPDLNDVIPFPRQEFRGIGGLFRFRRWLQDFRKRPAADVALDFQGLFRSGYVARKSGAKTVLGMSDSREFSRLFHHVRVPVEARSHAIDRYLRLAEACGASGPVQFPLPEGNCPEVLARAALPRDFVVLHPFSRGENKSLSGLQARNFCELLAPIGVFVVGHAEVPEHLLHLPPNSANILNQTTLPELVWMMRKARFVVSVDSGPMHIAAAVNPNVLGIHTWSDPREVGPYPAEAAVWKNGEIFPRSAMNDARAAGNRPFQDDDLPALVDFVFRRLESAARPRA